MSDLTLSKAKLESSWTSWCIGSDLPFTACRTHLTPSLSHSGVVLPWRKLPSVLCTIWSLGSVLLLKVLTLGGGSMDALFRWVIEYAGWIQLCLVDSVMPSGYWICTLTLFELNLVLNLWLHVLLVYQSSFWIEVRTEFMHFLKYVFSDQTTGRCELWCSSVGWSCLAWCT